MGTTAIIEVTENCNLACNFCLRPSFTQPIMTLDTLEKVIAHIIETSEERTDFVWHGGEPLLAGLNFFENIPEFQRKYNFEGIAINNNVQTNATLIETEYNQFFKREKFTVGTSIQGIKETHDKSRLTLGKKPTFDLVIDKISRLTDKPGSIIVLTTEIMGNEEEIYQSTKRYVRGLRISEYFPGGLNPQKDFKKNPRLLDRPEPLMPTPIEYGKSMIKFYEIWKKDPNPIDLRPITEIIRSMITGKSEGCLYSQEVCTKSIIGVKFTGDFYTCIRGYPDDKFFIGHVDTKPLKKYQKSTKEVKNSRIKKLMEGPCGNCQFWDYCNGGCPLESWKIFGDLDHRTWYCEGRKMLFEEIWKDLHGPN